MTGGPFWARPRSAMPPPSVGYDVLMRPRIFLALPLAACTPASAPKVSDPVETGAPAVETGPVADTADTAPAETADTAPERAFPVGEPGDLDHVPEDPLEGLCQVALDCVETVSADQTSCTLSVSSEDGRVWYDGPAVAWLRGRSTFYVAKHQYAIELHDEDGESVEVDLLGMGKESDWVLNGNYYDRLLVRNRLGFELFQSFGGDERYAPESAFCELTLDGAYVGAYSLVERIKRDGSRIDIERDDGEGGSFVLKQNDEGCLYDNTTTYGCWKLIYPNEDDISDGSAEGVKSYLAAWEAAVSSDAPYDDETGVFAYADMDSFVDIVILEEFFKNEDAWYTSLHIWKDQGGTIHLTPWDLDMTFGQFPYYPYGDYDNPEVWINYRPQLITVMAADPAFKARLAARWAELRADQMRLDAIYARIDHLQGILGDAIARNFEVWPIETINYGGYFYEVGSYEDEDAYVRAWIEARLAWMDENIADY